MLDEPEANEAIIWVIGQFANKIENADELMDLLVDNFLDEPTEVRHTDFVAWPIVRQLPYRYNLPSSLLW